MLSFFSCQPAGDGDAQGEAEAVRDDVEDVIALLGEADAAQDCAAVGDRAGDRAGDLAAGGTGDEDDVHRGRVVGGEDTVRVEGVLRHRPDHCSQLSCRWE